MTTVRNLHHSSLCIKAPSGAMRTLGPQIHHTRLALPLMDEATTEVWSDMLTSCGDIATGQVAGLVEEGAYVPSDFSQLVRNWLTGIGITKNTLRTLTMSPLACRGASFHSDAHSFSDFAFVVVWLSDDAGLDLLFPQLEQRIPLEYGTAVIFDCAQIHGVVPRGTSSFPKDEFDERLSTGCFVSIDLPIHRSSVAQPLGVRRTNARLAREAGIEHFLGWTDGYTDRVCATTGAWSGRYQADAHTT
ncbi:hypothetical protein ACOTHJ_12740 [Achromobacter xylosoxidans]